MHTIPQTESAAQQGFHAGHSSRVPPKSHEPISEADYQRIWRGSKTSLDVTLRLFRMAGVPPKARCALLALSTILRPGTSRAVTRAALAARLDRDETTAGRYIDALEAYQEASGYQFVIIERCGPNEKKPATFTDQWDGLLFGALRDAMKAGAPIDEWVRGVSGANQPANLAREDVALEIFERVPWRDPIKPDKPPPSPEEEQQTREDKARRDIARSEPRLRDVFADLERNASILPFAVQAELARLKKLIPQLEAKVSERANDFAFRERFPDTPEEAPEPIADDESGMVNTWALFDSETNSEQSADMCKMHLGEGQNKGVTGEKPNETDIPEADPLNNFWEPPTDGERLEAALSYARLGRRILPVYGVTEGVCHCRKGKECTSAGKHPWPKDWPNKATTDEDQIRSWWAQRPASNIGWAMGDGYLTLDFDGAEGEAVYRVLLEGGTIPETIEQRTGSGGRQVVFGNAPDLKNEVRLLPGLDLRSAGGQIVVPPSISGKGAYHWRSNLTEPANLPDLLLELIQTLINDEKEAKEREREASRVSVPASGFNLRKFGLSKASTLPSVIPFGQRNNALFQYACGWRNSGADYQTLLEILTDRNSRCTPPLSAADLEDIVRSVMRYRPETVPA